MNKKITIIAMLVLILALSLSLAACGGDGDNSNHKGDATPKVSILEKYNDYKEVSGLTDAQLSFLDVSERSMTFDTNPYDDPDDSFGMMSNGAILMNILENYLGVTNDVIFNMKHTSAMDGRQTATSGDFVLTWKYHPNTGLEGTVTVK